MFRTCGIFIQIPERFMLSNNQEKHFNWDYHLQLLKKVNLTDAEKKNVAVAVCYLRDILGEDFLERSFKEDHPFLLYYLINRAPWVWLSLLRFSNILRSFES